MRQHIVYAFLLGIVWCFVSGDLSIINFIIGAFLGFFIIHSMKKIYPAEKKVTIKDYILRIYKVLIYLSILMVEITKASILIAKVILRPKLDIKPGVIEFPLRASKDVSVTAIANTISLTPGTLTIDVSDDMTKLYVHSIDVSDPQALRESIRNHLEKYVVEAFE